MTARVYVTKHVYRTPAGHFYDDRVGRARVAPSEADRRMALSRAAEAQPRARGVYVPRQLIEKAPIARNVPNAIMRVRERIRGTRIAALRDVVLPGITVDEATDLLNAQYDMGGNYVLRVLRARVEYTVEPMEYGDFDLGDDGSADES